MIVQCNGWQVAGAIAPVIVALDSVVVAVGIKSIGPRRLGSVLSCAAGSLACRQISEDVCQS